MIEPALRDRFDHWLAGNPAQAISDPELQELFTDPEFTEASSNVQQWLDENCENQ